ncbi:MAG: putative DNA-binding domain-containing protein [Verrucomicrobia bacterium]|nr:putative DNA-binding domain-containing protein [Verrucomicrobiota bacterium]
MNCPASLLEMQHWIAKILTRPLRKMGEDALPIFDEETGREIDEKLTSGPHLTAQQRIGIYNQQFWFRVFTVLQEQYPTLTRLFGFAAFNREVAEPYLLRYPPNHWILAKFGARLPQWLQEEYNQSDKMLVYEAALVDAAYENGTPGQVLSLHADLFAFRAQMLAHEPEHWIHADFPRIEWGPLRHYVLPKR